jgi:hypothetical protein
VNDTSQAKKYAKRGNKRDEKSVLMGDGVVKQTEGRLQEQNKLASFEEAVLPHLNAAYNLARWLTRNDADTGDVVQEALRKATTYAIPMTDPRRTAT